MSEKPNQQSAMKLLTSLLNLMSKTKRSNEMSEKPIIFSVDMVRAILDGGYQKGDLLWVKETYAPFEENTHVPDKYKVPYIYSADYTEEEIKIIQVEWKSSHLMPKKAARIWLKVVEI
jgi:hypothetical protein